MPTFNYDLSREAVAYVQSSIKDMPGNPGQEVLIEALDIDCNASLEVHIAGELVETNATGDIKLTSSHPEAIEEIIKQGEQAFEEFLDGLSKPSFAASASLNILETIRQGSIDEAFGEL